MNGNEYLKQLGGIDGKYVDNAAEMEKTQLSGPRFVWVAAAAAAACLVIVGGILIFGGRKPNGEQNAVVPPTDAPATQQSAVTPIPTDVPATADPTSVPTAAPDPFIGVRYADTANSDDGWDGILESLGGEEYVIYHGKLYVPYMSFQSFVRPELFELIGEKLGDVTYAARNGEAMINESVAGSAAADGAELGELTGSFSGPIYALRGYDPESVIAFVDEGVLHVYFSGSGVVSGADLFENRFSLRERLTDFLYETHISGEQNGDSLTRRLDPADPAVARFLDAIDSAEWVENDLPNERVPAIFWLHLMLTDGMSVELTVYGTGEVLFNSSICPKAIIRPDSEAVAALAELLSERKGEATLLPEKDFGRQLAYLGTFGGFGACLPKETPEGYTIVDFFANAVLDGRGVPVGYSEFGVMYDAVKKYPHIFFTVKERSAYDASPYYVQNPDLTVSPLEPIAIEDFTREMIHDSVFEKMGQEHTVKAVVSKGDMVIIVHGDYIIDGEIGSLAELEKLIDTVYELIVNAGK